MTHTTQKRPQAVASSTSAAGKRPLAPIQYSSLGFRGRGGALAPRPTGLPDWGGIPLLDLHGLLTWGAPAPRPPPPGLGRCRTPTTFPAQGDEGGDSFPNGRGFVGREPPNPGNLSRALRARIRNLAGTNPEPSRNRTGTNLAPSRLRRAGARLVPGRLRVGSGLVPGWFRIGDRVGSGCLPKGPPPPRR